MSMLGDYYLCIDRNIVERTSHYLLQADAITAGTALLATIEDDSLAVVLLRSGAPAGHSPAQPLNPALFDTVQLFRYLKLGELRYFNGTVTYTPLAHVDGLLRTDTDLS